MCGCGRLHRSARVWTQRRTSAEQHGDDASQRNSPATTGSHFQLMIGRGFAAFKDTHVLPTDIVLSSSLFVTSLRGVVSGLAGFIASPEWGLAQPGRVVHPIQLRRSARPGSLWRFPDK